MKGINLNPLLPVRVEPREQSEQCTQLLFGEMFTYEVVSDGWCFVVNDGDGYEGYVSKNMVTFLTGDEVDVLIRSTKHVVSSALARVECGGGEMWLPMGSVLYGLKDGVSELMGMRYRVREEDVVVKGDVVDAALRLLHAPYLWGGKSVLGVDCSGLVQVAFRACGRLMVRDASQQVEEGEVVCFLNDAQRGDLVFFENDEGRIVHVGILIDNRHVVHSPGIRASYSIQMQSMPWGTSRLM